MLQSLAKGPPDSRVPEQIQWCAFLWFLIQTVQTRNLLSSFCMDTLDLCSPWNLVQLEIELSQVPVMVLLEFGVIRSKRNFGIPSYVSLKFIHLRVSIFILLLVRTPIDDPREFTASSLTNGSQSKAISRVNAVVWCVCDAYVATSMGDCTIRVSNFAMDF